MLAFAYVSPGKPQGYVSDFASVLSSTARTTIEEQLSAFEKATGNQIAVVTIKSLGDDYVENFAVELFKDWGIGQKGKDNGILILVAVDDHKMRIEVGYGLEGVLIDSQASSIIRNIMTPAFRANDFDGGISGAVNQIIATVSADYASNAGISAEQLPEDNRPRGYGFSEIFYFILFIPIWLASILGRSKAWWAGGVVGGIAGVAIGIFFGFFYLGILAIVFFIPVGLLFDFLVSRAYTRSVGSGLRPPWWIGGGRMGGGGGFGGFGGGGSGGGGSSGSW